jgi:hypothetical protein
MADQKFNNTKNQDSELFKRLTKLFSGPIVNYNQPVQSRYRRNQIDKFGQKFTSASGLEFKKSVYNPYENFSSKMMSNQNRADRYIDFDQMEYMPEIASALDIYADEMTTSNELNNMLNIKCGNEEIKSILNTLYNKTLNLDSNLFNWCRNMCKYGDHFLYLDIDETLGIKSAIGLPANQIERMEGKDPTNPNYVQFQWNSGGLTFENWQVAHFRILGNDKYSPYGTSVLDPARRIWRQLTLLEDAMMAYRITRSPERKVFYIDVGNIPPQEVEQYMQRAMTSMKRNQIVDQNTGRVDLRYNPMSVDEDYFIPVRGGQNNTKIDALPGGQFASAIEDVKYLRDKLFAALKVPKAFMGYEKDLTGKATLAAEDIRFARTVERIQRILVSELTKIALVHLYVQGYDGEALTNFELSLTTPSIIYDQERIALMKEKVDLAKQIQESNLMPSDWIYDNVFHFSEDEIDEYRDLVIEDKKRLFRMKQVEEEGNDPAETGQAFGTPHQLATLYGTGRYTSSPNAPSEIPLGYDEKQPNIVKMSGRPQSKVSTIDTQKSPFGKDRLGRKEYSAPEQGDAKLGKTQYKGGSPLALESTQAVYLQNKNTFDGLSTFRKINLFETKDNDGLLSEDNIMSL